MSERQEYRMGVGASSILMIFVVLCMTTLGVLSFASARSDLVLTERRQSFVQSYQAATAKAEEALASLDLALMVAQADAQTYRQKVRSLTMDGVAVSVSDSLEITLEIPFGEAQLLEVIVQAHEPGAPERFTRVSHMYYSTDEWMPEGFWDLSW